MDNLITLYKKRITLKGAKFLQLGSNHDRNNGS
ncbi:Uncharacterised protein [Legionella waltersii]|nr:Uncharacterised protein [Legionella waltersii]